MLHIDATQPVQRVVLRGIDIYRGCLRTNVMMMRVASKKRRICIMCCRVWTRALLGTSARWGLVTPHPEALAWKAGAHMRNRRIAQ